MKGLKPIFLLTIVMMFTFSLSVFASDLALTTDNKVPGKPFQDLQNEINYLQQQIDDMQGLQNQINDLQQQIDDIVLEHHATSTTYVSCNQTSSNSAPECAAVCPGGTVVTGGGINTWSHSSALKINLATTDASTSEAPRLQGGASNDSLK